MPFAKQHSFPTKGTIMVSGTFDSDITFGVRSYGRRVHITVINDVLIIRFRASDGSLGMITASARYAPVLP